MLWNIESAVAERIRKVVFDLPVCLGHAVEDDVEGSG